MIFCTYLFGRIGCHVATSIIQMSLPNRFWDPEIIWMEFDVDAVGPEMGDPSLCDQWIPSCCWKIEEQDGWSALQLHDAHWCHQSFLYLTLFSHMMRKHNYSLLMMCWPWIITHPIPPYFNGACNTLVENVHSNLQTFSTFISKFIRYHHSVYVQINPTK